MHVYSRLAATALIGLFVTGSADAYELSPPHTASHLKGVLNFLDSKGRTQFKCRVDFHVYVRNPPKNSPRFSQVTTYDIVIPSRDCPSTVQFDGKLPWSIGVLNATTTQVADGGWSNGLNNACSGGSTFFNVDSNGIWTVQTDHCLSGKLVSTPPITIVSGPS